MALPKSLKIVDGPSAGLSSNVFAYGYPSGIPTGAGTLNVYQESSIDMQIVTELTHGAIVGTFTVGETITGGTSGATALYVGISGSRIRVRHIVGGPFTNGETITGGTSAAHTTVTATIANSAFIAGETVTDGTTGATAEYISNTASAMIVVELSGSVATPDIITGNTSGGIAWVNTGGATSTNFTIGETITGGTSAATAKLRINDSGLMTIDTIVGTFVDEEIITGGTSGAKAEVNGAVIFYQYTAVIKAQVRDVPQVINIPNYKNVSNGYPYDNSTRLHITMRDTSRFSFELQECDNSAWNAGTQVACQAAQNAINSWF